MVKVTGASSGREIKEWHSKMKNMVEIGQWKFFSGMRFREMKSTCGERDIVLDHKLFRREGQNDGNSSVLVFR